MGKIKVFCLGRDLRPGGAQRVQLSLLERLDQRRFDIRLVYLHDGGAMASIIPSNLSPTFLLREGSSLKRNGIKVLKSLREMTRWSDLVFGMQEGTPLYLAAIVGRIERRPVVGWVHTTWTQMLEERLSNWHGSASAALYPLMRSIVCVSDGVASDLIAWNRRLARKALSIPNPVDLDSVKQLAREPFPDWANTIFAKPTIIGVGRFAAVKRFDLLIRAFAEAHAKGVDANLLILGEGELRPELEALIRELGIEDRAFLPGFQLNPYPFIKAAAVAVSTSDYEGFSMAILEAMALGTPVISTDCPYGPSELLQGGKCGMLVPVGSVSELATGISAAVRHTGCWNERVESAIQHSYQFDAERIAREFERFFLGTLDTLTEPKL